MFCINCGSEEADGKKFCVQCGAKLEPVRQTAASGTAGEPNPESAAKFAFTASEFASGLPDWDLIPPQMIVRRVKRG